MNVYRFINKIKMFNTQFLVKQFNKSAAMKTRKKTYKSNNSRRLEKYIRTYHKKILKIHFHHFFRTDKQGHKIKAF